MNERNINKSTSMPFFSAWIRGRNHFNDKKTNTLDEANLASNTFFGKNYNEIYTYEKKYIIQQLVKAGVN